MRYSEDHKAATRQRLVRETAEVIRREGLEAVGVASVMNRLGLTHGGFYAHFRSRDELVAAGVRQMFEDGRALDARSTQSEPAQALAALINGYLSRGHRDMTLGACPLPVLSGDAPRLPEPSRDAYARGAEALRGTLTKLITELGHPDPAALGSSALAEMVGAVALARAEPDPERSDGILSASREALKTRFGLGDLA